jgi:YihY family inner membrane protein
VNRFEALARRADARQQAWGPAAFTVGVVKKFGDDNAGVLVSNLAYSGFICVFPLLLILVTVVDLVLAGDPSVRKTLLDSALGEFPVIGTQLGHNIHGLQRSSVIGLIVGVVGLVWGSTGLAQAGQFTMGQVWNLDSSDRPGYVTRLSRSAVFLVVLAVGLVLSTALAGFGTFGHHNEALGLVGEVLAVVVNAATYLLVFRVLTPKVVETATLVPGALVGGVGWTVLLAVGGYLVGHDLRNDSATYGVFAAVLGLVAWVYLGCELFVYSAEVNSVLARRLWPRGLVQPPLTEADHRSLASQATENRRRPDQRIAVGFGSPPMTQAEWLRSEGGAATTGSDGGDAPSDDPSGSRDTEDRTVPARFPGGSGPDA